MALLSEGEVGGTRWYVHMLVRFAALFSSSKMSTLGYWNIRGVTIHLQPLYCLINLDFSLRVIASTQMVVYT